MVFNALINLFNLLVCAAVTLCGVYVSYQLGLMLFALLLLIGSGEMLLA
ncbi:MAG: hypothetical protein ACI9FJ_002248 [Alteromonadaceae bacterium]|jgi:hypothetical protein